MKAIAQAETGPSGSSQTIVLRRWRAGVGTVIVAGGLSVLAGGTTASTTAFTEGLTFAPGDYLTIDSACADTPGTNLFVELQLQEI